MLGLPADMRAEICEKKPAEGQSEAAAEDPAQATKSQWLEKIPNPRLVKVGLGGATGPVPKGWQEHNGDQEVADVPIPTPRPDYPGDKAAAQGDTASN